jgi:hypothetical protein
VQSHKEEKEELGKLPARSMVKLFSAFHDDTKPDSPQSGLRFCCERANDARFSESPLRLVIHYSDQRKKGRKTRATHNKKKFFMFYLLNLMHPLQG